MSKMERRSGLFIYKSVQWLILKVILASVLLSSLAIIGASIFYYNYLLSMYQQSDDIEIYQVLRFVTHHGPIYFIFLTIALLFAFAVIIYSWLKLSNKVAGPLYQIRKNLSEYVEGQNNEFVSIKLRKGDELHDLAEIINAAMEKKSKSG